jgi:transcriptional regulator with XRE-family HTH domain
MVSMDANGIETEAMRTAIANQMRIQRTIRRWSQDDLAKAAGLGRSTILRLETSKIAMDIKHMQAISEAFGMPWLEFMKLVNDELEAQE